LSIKIFDVIALDRWKSLDLRVSSLIYAGLFVSFGVVLASVVARALFFLLDRNSSYRERIGLIYSSIPNKEIPIDKRLIALELISKVEAPVKKGLASFVCLAQGSFSIGGYLFLFQSSSLDCLISLGVFFVGILSTVRSVQIFVSDYYPISAIRERIEGRNSGRIDGI